MKNNKQNIFFFFGLFAGIIVLSFLVLQPYLSLAFLAFLLTALYSPVFKAIKRLVKFDGLASILSVLVMFLSILIPLGGVGVLAYNQIIQFNKDIQSFLEANELIIQEKEEEKGNSLSEVNKNLLGENAFLLFDEEDDGEVDPNSIGNLDVDKLVEEINNTLNSIPFLENQEVTRGDIDQFIVDVIGPATDFAADTAISIGGSSLTIITNSIVFVILLITLFPAHLKVESFYKKVSPLDDKIDEVYLQKLTKMGVAMIKGTFVIATLQGIISGIFLYIAGVDYVVFWVLLSILVSIIPLGAGIVNIPIGIVLILTGNIWQGVMIILANIFIVGQVDTVLRPKLVPKDAQLSEILTLLGVLGGVQFFGPLGFIYGPIVMILLMTTLDVYLKHYKEVITANR